jgi:carboxypeptidase family protein/TonB-dependent receptor-like protein
MRPTARALLATLVFLCLPVLGAAQATTGSISGVITDMSGAALPGADITVTQTETGLVRQLVSDSSGYYRALNLNPGQYRVVAGLPGFRVATVDRLVVTVSRDLRVDIELQLPIFDSEVTVRAETRRVDVGATAVGGVVSTQQISELPLNGRSFMQLASLQPGVVVSRGTGKGFTGGFGQTQLAFGGARPEHTGYLMDGTNIADISDKAPSSVAGVLLGVDTLQEFSVQTHGYSAEYGRAAGGLISAVTKSGTNQLHGTGFEFHRDSALDARNPFDVAAPPGFRRNQFGGTFGGPILQNRLFFFTGYEGLRDERSITRYARLPNALAHQGLVPDASGVLQNVGVHPTVRPYLDLLFPTPTGQDFGDGTAELAHAHVDPTNENFWVGKIDWQAANNDSFLFRLSRDTSDSLTSQEHPLFVESADTTTRYLTGQHQHLFNANLLNVLRVAANRTARNNDLLPTVNIPRALFFSEDPHWGAITVTGLSIAGSTATIPVEYTQDVYELADTFTWVKGGHTWKSGFDWQNYHFDGFSYSRYGGEFRFRNLNEFLTLRRSGTAQADRFTGNLPGTDTNRRVRQHYVSMFAQDDWRLRDGLTVSAGLRYEFVTDPRELNGALGGLLSFDDLESGPRGITPGSPLFDNPSKGSLAPRLGVAWSPRGDHRTTVRGGWGVFYQPLTVSFYRGTVFRVYPYFAGVDIRQPAVFGPGNIAVLAAGVNPTLVQKRSEFIEYDLEQPFIQQWHAEIERELPFGLVGEAGYVGSKGSNLPFYGDPNAVPSEYTADGTKRIVPGATLRYPSWGRIRTRTNVARSIYHGLILGLNRRFNQGLMLQGSYTYGNSRDTWSGGQLGDSDFDNGVGNATDWWDPEYEFGPSNFDVRHNLVLNGVYQLPWGRGLTGVAGALASGWNIGGVAQFSSGIPFTPYIGFDRAGDLMSDTGQQKPNVNGAVVYPHTAAQWFDPASFSLPAVGIFGNAGRNSLRAPGVKVADVSVFKNVPAGHATVQLRLEAFNVFNWVNLGLPSAAVLFNPDGSRFAGAGRITSTSTPARQLQVGLKILF